MRQSAIPYLTGSQVKQFIRQLEARILVDGLTDQKGQFVRVLARSRNPVEEGKRMNQSSIEPIPVIGQPDCIWRKNQPPTATLEAQLPNLPSLIAGLSPILT